MNSFSVGEENVFFGIAVLVRGGKEGDVNMIK